MNRLGRCVLAAVLAILATMTVLGTGTPANAAGPGTGTVTAVFADLCGFVKADFTNADPFVAAQIHRQRDGVDLGFGFSSFVFANGGTATIYVPAAGGQVISYYWDVNGGTGIDQLDHTHVTPGGCDEPNISVAITADSCQYQYTFRISNTGSATGHVLVLAPTLNFSEVTIPPGGNYDATVPSLAGTRVTVGVLRPGVTTPDFNTDFLVWDSAQREEGCGATTAPDGTHNSFAFFTPTSCTNVRIDFFDLNEKGLLDIYRNGSVALETSIGGDVYTYNIAAVGGDLLSIGIVPPIDYTVVAPPGCQVAPAVLPPATSAAPPASPSVSPSPSSSPTRTPSGPETTAAGPVMSSSGEDQHTEALHPVNVAMVSEVGLTGLLAGLVVFLLWFRRRPKVKAIGVPAPRRNLTVLDIGTEPTRSLRWVPHLDPGVQTLWEGRS